MLNRYYDRIIEENINPNKVLVIYGPRQVGKTTLIETYLKSLDSNLKYQ